MSASSLPQRLCLRVVSLAVIVFLLVAAVSAIPVVHEFQLRIADTYFLTAPPPPQPSPVVLVLIDDESLRAYGRWPWSRARVAELVRQLDRAGAGVIGLDVLFSEPQSANIDRELANALRENRRTVIVDKIGMYPDGPHWIEPLPMLADAALGVGHAQAVLGSDGLCRRFPLRELTVDGPRLAFALEIARHIDAAQTAQFLAAYGITGREDNAAIMTTAPVLAPIAFRRDPFRSISAAAVLQGRDLGIVRGRPVLVGFGPTEISDRLNTPLTGQWPASGVEIHAQVLDSVLSGRKLHQLPLLATIILLFATCIDAVLILRNQKGWSVIVWVALLGAIVYFAGWSAFVLGSRILAVGPMLLAVIFAPVAVYAADFVLVERSVRKQMQLLRQWLMQHRRYELREDSDDISRNLELLQGLQMQLGSLYELHETLLEATRDAIAIFDSDSRLILQNRIFGRIFRSGQQLKSMQEVQAEIRWIEGEARLEQGKAVEGEAYVQNELYAIRLVPLPPATLSPKGGMIWIVTSLKAREERDRSRAEALGFITHELRTPLTSILGFAELMVEYPDSPQCAGAPETIFRESKRLLALIYNYLDVLRLDAGARPLKREDVSVNEVVHQVFAILRPLAASKQMKLSWQGEQAIAASGDSALLSGAVLNVVSNAIKYGETGSEIHVSCEQRGDQVVISVHNYGSPIKSVDLPNLFSPYYRGVSDRDGVPGWGLGLAFVKRTAEKHGGSVHVESSSAGTTFTIHLPAVMPVVAVKGAR
jgi:signal transduction histidine kinase/CHASE2 domain-containing sensor protein